MDIQAKKIELIKIIADIQSEVLLEKLKQYLQLFDHQGTEPKSSVLSDSEANLILKINEGLPEPIQARYHYLQKKSVEESLSEDEQKELHALIPQVEALQVERLASIAELATLWKCSVEEVMEKLGIPQPTIISG